MKKLLAFLLFTKLVLASGSYETGIYYESSQDDNEKDKSFNIVLTDFKLDLGKSLDFKVLLENKIYDAFETYDYLKSDTKDSNDNKLLYREKIKDKETLYTEVGFDFKKKLNKRWDFDFEGIYKKEFYVSSTGIENEDKYNKDGFLLDASFNYERKKIKFDMESSFELWGTDSSNFDKELNLFLSLKREENDFLDLGIAYEFSQIEEKDNGKTEFDGMRNRFYLLNEIKSDLSERIKFTCENSLYYSKKETKQGYFAISIEPELSYKAVLNKNFDFLASIEGEIENKFKKNEDLNYETFISTALKYSFE